MPQGGVLLEQLRGTCQGQPPALAHLCAFNLELDPVQGKSRDHSPPALRMEETFFQKTPNSQRERLTELPGLEKPQPGSPRRLWAGQTVG